MSAAKGPPEACRACRKPLPRNAKFRPFCSDRCRLVDLGRWFHGDYVVSRPIRPDEAPPEEE